MMINPAIVFMVGGLLVAASPLGLRRVLSVTIPIVALWQLFSFPDSYTSSLQLFQYVLEPLRIDPLSFIFSLVFILAALVVGIYSLHNNKRLEQTMIQLYAGSSLGAVLSGDLISLFVYFEISAITSAMIVYIGGFAQSNQAAIRYFVIQVIAGLLLLVGILSYSATTGSVLFERMQLGSIGANLIFLAFGIKCAFPFLHNWLQDAYPKASVIGTVALSAFTTKLAVYCLARGFAGTSELIWIGAAMTAFPIFFAVIENDLRKVLSYSLNNQLGFMVVGVGIGTELALNGTAAHAFCHILYKALLFMSMGAVLHRVGTTKASELGGLYKSMPLTTVFCIIGALSISALPLLSGFVSKGIILYATAKEGLWFIWLVLLFASAGVLDHSGIKVPFFTFFSHDGGHRTKEAPVNMLIAMGITAFACILIGVYPTALYQLLPYPLEYHPYTLDHVVTQLQLLFFALLAFIVLYRTGLYPPEIKAINLDTDWFYRRLLKGVAIKSVTAFRGVALSLNLIVATIMESIGLAIKRSHGPSSTLARGVTVGTTVIWVALLLSVCIIFYNF